MLIFLLASPALLVWPQATDAQWAMVPIAGKSFGPRAGAILSLAAGVVPSLFLLHHARRLFAHFAKGEVFNTASIGHIRAAGLWLLISPFANIAMQMGLHWTIDAPAHDPRLNPQTLIFGIATFIAAYVIGGGTAYRRRKCEYPVMIVVQLDVMLAKRKMRSKELAERIGFTEANISLLKSGKVKGVRFETLEKICEVLECQPGDLLEYKPQ
jgi:putative transcriptional regulator